MQFGKKGKIMDQFVKEKVDFVDALQKRGYTVIDDHGCVDVIAGKEDYAQIVEDVRALAKEKKYDMSFGVKMKQD